MTVSGRDIGRYTIVPEWVAMADISAVAKILYLHLGLHADWETGECFPSRKRLAELCGCSESTIKRALKELEEVEAIRRSARWRDDGSQASNLYIIVTAVPPSQTSMVTPRGLTVEPPPGTPVTPLEREPLELEQKTSSSVRRDAIWDTLEEFCGPVATKSERSKRGAVVKEIRSVVGASDEVAVEEIRRRVKVYEDEWGSRGFALTDTALMRHWSKLGLMASNGGTQHSFCNACEGSGHDGVGGDCRVCKGTGRRNPATKGEDE